MWTVMAVILTLAVIVGPTLCLMYYSRRKK
jgi:hypothetical protein